MFEEIRQQLTTDQLFMLVCLMLVFFILFLFYFHRLLTLYSKRVDAVMEWNKRFLKPMYFRYSWLKGVKIGVQERKKGRGINEESRKEQRRKSVRSKVSSRDVRGC